MSLRTTITTLIFMLALSACGGGGAACGPAYHGRPVWTPDGARIDYEIDRAGAPPDIHSMSAQGDDDRMLAHNAVRPHPSPDGRRLLYIHADSDGVPGPGPSEYALLDLETMQDRTLGDMGSVDWSPDGRWIVYSLGETGPLMKLDAATGRATALGEAAQQYQNWDPMWSPDGSRIAFASDRDGPRALYLMNADGSAVTRLTSKHTICTPEDSPAEYVLQDWRPDGGALAYVSLCREYREPKLITVDGVDLNPQVQPYKDINGMEWSPDGKHIALGLEDRDGALRIDVADVDGSNQKTVHSGGFYPHWSPDPAGTGSGKRIVFEAWDQDHLTQFYVMDLDSPGSADPGGSGSNVVQMSSDSWVCPR